MKAETKPNKVLKRQIAVIMKDPKMNRSDRMIAIFNLFSKDLSGDWENAQCLGIDVDDFSLLAGLMSEWFRPISNPQCLSTGTRPT